MTRVAAAKVLGFRVRRHRLDRPAPAGSLLEVVRELCGVHAQIAASAEIALWARIRGLAREEVRAALEDERTLVKTWAMRGTLHLLTADDLPLYVAVLGPAWAKPSGAWLRGHGIREAEYEAVLTSIPRALGARPRTREQLAEKIAEVAGPAMRERVLSGWGAILKPAAHRGELAFGPNRGRNVTFVRPDRWLRGWAGVGADEARGELVRRFLRAYGPATADELGRWLGWRGAAPKRLLAEVEDELVEVEGGWLLAADLAVLKNATAPKSVRLLPAFDPYVVGARPRELLVDAEHAPRVFRPQAWFSPVVLVAGRAAGIWERERRGRRLAIRIEPFAPLSAATQKALAEEADRLGEFLDAPAELSVAA
jgi:Winged helix DNA-binding domain